MVSGKISTEKLEKQTSLLFREDQKSSVGEGTSILHSCSKFLAGIDYDIIRIPHDNGHC